MKQHLDLATFEGCSRRERALIARLGTTVVVAAGRRLSTQGVAGRQFAIVLDGELSVRRDGHPVTALHAGDCVGEIALLIGPNSPATATVEAADATTVWVLSSGEFSELIERPPRWPTGSTTSD